MLAFSRLDPTPRRKLRIWDFLVHQVHVLRSTSYIARVRNTNPIAYWPMSETSGSAVIDFSGNGLNGAYTGVTLGQPGIGDGRTSPLYDGTTSYANMSSAGLIAAIDGSEGTLAGWLQIEAAADWQNATREPLSFQADANNFIRVTSFGNPNFQWRYKAGGTEVNRIVTETATGWLHYAITWSATNDEVILYRNAVQQGATLTGLGGWAGNLVTLLIGATSAVPTSPWKGYMAHWAFWDSPLALATISDLAVV